MVISGVILETTLKDDSVQDEQFGDSVTVPENMKNPTDNSEMAEKNSIAGDADNASLNPDNADNTSGKLEVAANSNEETLLSAEEDHSAAEPHDTDPGSEAKTPSEQTGDMGSEKDPEQKPHQEDHTVAAPTENLTDSPPAESTSAELPDKPADKEEDQEVADEAGKEEIQKVADEAGKEEVQEVADEEITVKEVDYTTFSIDELVNTLTILISERPVQEIRNDVENIKVNFYKKHKIELEKKKKAFLAEGGDIIDFMPGEDPRETQIKELLAKYRSHKSAYNKDLELQKQKNLEEKYQIIEEIKDLINRKESINKTFQEFRDLQSRWREVGVVPQQTLKDLWDTYHHHVEKFYDYIKINKELRDLDLKKNQEAKIKLCERAEELIMEPSVVNAFKKLQKLHDQWREIGPVPHESKNELWERFREATSKINKKHQEFYEELKSSQKKNLEAKTHLCEQVEEINKNSISSHKEWDKKSTEVIELQKIWRTIGYAPKKSNNKIYQRFREACDAFFSNKREFYVENREIQDNNLQQKIELCIQAESLKNSTEWQKTTEDLIQLQKKWKEIGPVHRKHSGKIWKRFRSACDTFFQKKSEYYSQIDSTYEDNLKLKKELIKEIGKFKPVEDMEDNFNQLNDFQRRWTEIGYVPFKYKDEILQEYRDVINKAFDNLKVGENQKSLLKYKNKLVNIRENPKAELKIKQDREKFMNKIKQLENDIVLWENNIGFFAKSKNADSMINDVHEKINRAKNSIMLLEEKIQLIDQSDTD